MSNEENTRRERDMILAPNEFAFISDETKGEVNVFVGPNKTSLANTDRPVVFDKTTKRFRSTDLSQATQTFQTAPEGWYVIMKNPAEGDRHPSGSGKLTTPALHVGKKVNISGPASFALWPGQMAKVVQGHNLRSNEYLLVRVYDEEAARANWGKAVIKAQGQIQNNDQSNEQTSQDKNESTTAAAVDIPSAEDLSMGKLFVIRGTDVSFYIPSTGIEVIPERVNNVDRYVREAVSLERLEYCLLLDQDGTKRYVHGPAVVFPRPTEKFVEAPIKNNPEGQKAKKFRAQELTPTTGIHIRVIADYTDENGKERKAGEELFITGNEQTIYFPREEHAMIKYGEQEIHFGIAIPVGEARYVLDRDDGSIRLVQGPKIFLPDPRHEVIINRALDLRLVSLLYPGNKEALAINAERLGITDADIMGSGGGEQVFGAIAGNATYDVATAAVATPDTNRRVMIRGAAKTLPGDAFDRKNTYTAPRSIVLNTKFNGAVTTTVWPGYAMQLIRKNGERRVVQGPGTFMLEYDESPQVVTLSTGKPKTTDNLMQTVFLLTMANKVSDIVEVETSDFCRLSFKLSYRVNFEGDPNRWFNVDNYVKFLCDHMRSRIRSAIQKRCVEEVYGHHTEILRNIILGESPGEGKPRIGTSFSENGMRIYDVEVFDVKMLNGDVEKMLMNAQRDVIQNTLTLAAERRKLSFIQESEAIKRQIAETNAETTQRLLVLQAEETERRLQAALVTIHADAKAEAERAVKELANARAQQERNAVQLAVLADTEAQKHATARANAQLEAERLAAQVKAVVDKATAVSPDLIAALTSFGDKAMIEKVAEAMAPLSILGGGSVVDVLKKLLEGSPLAKQLEGAPNGDARVSRPHA